MRTPSARPKQPNPNGGPHPFAFPCCPFNACTPRRKPPGPEAEVVSIRVALWERDGRVRLNATMVRAGGGVTVSFWGLFLGSPFRGRFGVLGSGFGVPSLRVGGDLGGSVGALGLEWGFLGTPLGFWGSPLGFGAAIAVLGVFVGIWGHHSGFGGLHWGFWVSSLRFLGSPSEFFGVFIWGLWGFIWVFWGFLWGCGGAGGGHHCGYSGLRGDFGGHHWGVGDFQWDFGVSTGVLGPLLGFWGLFVGVLGVSIGVWGHPKGFEGLHWDFWCLHCISGGTPQWGFPPPNVGGGGVSFPFPFRVRMWVLGGNPLGFGAPFCRPPPPPPPTGGGVGCWLQGAEGRGAGSAHCGAAQEERGSGAALPGLP